MILINLKVAGMFQTNCYIFGSENTKEVVIIDPGGDSGQIKEVIDSNSLNPIAILLTHTHMDHKGGVKSLVRKIEIPVMYHQRDRGRMTKDANKWLNEGDIIEVGEYNLHVLETPGHSPGGISFYTKDVKKFRDLEIDGIVFTGDLLFRRSIGRSDVPGGDQEVLFQSIKNKIMYNKELTDNFVVFPGHMGKTTIGEERSMNIFRDYFL